MRLGRDGSAGNGFGQTTALKGGLAVPLHAADGEMRLRNATGEQPHLGSDEAIPVTQDHQQLLGKHDVAILAALALVNADRHAFAINVGGLQGHRLRDAQARCITRGEHGACLALRHAAQELPHLIGAQDDWQRLGLLRRWDHLFDVPRFLQRHDIQEAQRGSSNTDRAGRELLLVGQKHLIAADVLRTEGFRRFGEVAGKEPHLKKVGVLRVLGEVANLHVLEHASAKWCHGETPSRDEMAAHAATPFCKGD
jgi:hypothetical protein